MKTHYTLTRSPSGMLTFRDETTGEWLHRHFGPLAESSSVYAIGCKIPSRSGAITICDLGLGGGFNALCALSAALKNPNLSQVELESFDTTVQGIELLVQSIEHFGELSHFLPILRELLDKGHTERSLQRLNDGSVVRQTQAPELSTHLNLRWTVHVGDAFQCVTSLPPETKFDCIFYDLFSPAKCPGLWTRDAFRTFTRRISDNGVIATYSMSTSIRAALLSLGLYVGEGHLVAPNMRSTLASPNPTLLDSLLPPPWLGRFERSDRQFSSLENETDKETILKTLQSHPQWTLRQSI